MLAPDPLAGQLHPFSKNRAGLAVPEGWQNWLLGPTKPPTQYLTQSDPTLGEIVLHAHAERSASALLVDAARVPRKDHFIEWRWRADGLVERADLTQAALEDSPVRLILGFGGDSTKLGFRDQMFAERIKLVTGQELPYATLMYVWVNQGAVESILPNPHTGRIQMLAVESGAAHLGGWRAYVRDFAADFRRAYGEEPGPLIMVGVMTDTDNTGTVVDADYGDIRLNSIEASAVPSDTALGPLR